MSQPLKISVMQPSMAPVQDTLAYGHQAEAGGFDAIWLAEAYPWWRKHSMEARSATALSAVIIRETKRLAVGWGIVSSYSRDPIQIAMEAQVTHELAGPGRFYLGLGAAKIMMHHIGEGICTPARPYTNMKECIEIVTKCFAGEKVEFEGKEYHAYMPARRSDAQVPQTVPPIYVGGTGPKMQLLAAKEAAGLVTPTITTRNFIRHVVGNLRADVCSATSGLPTRWWRRSA